MRADALVAEIGSTVTKVHAFSGLDGSRPQWVGGGAAPTTAAQGDVTTGLRAAVGDLSRRLGEDVTWERMLAASSAAGGLRMAVHGLVYDMTVRAAREAALGAGAIIELVTVGKLGAEETDVLRRLRPGIILLAGGLEGGDREVVVHNAREIAGLRLGVPVVYAGNSAARAEVSGILGAAGVKVTVVPNVYPRLDLLDIEPARRAIQAVFEEHIILAPGMERVRDMVGGAIRPTPGAVMEAARLLRELLGDLVVIDVGGATTDVHSVTDGSTEIKRIQLHPEPVAKRTVEGDLGVYVNAANVVRLAGEDAVAEHMSAGPPDVGDLLARAVPVPPEDTDPEVSAFIAALTRLAAETALVRHAGVLRHLFGPTGRLTVAEGKDLTEVEWLVGTGGPLVRFPWGSRVLAALAGMPTAAALAARRRGGGSDTPGFEPGGPPASLLLPGRGARPVIDRRYLMAVLGVLHQEYPEAARALLRESVVPEAGGGEG